MKPEDVVAVYNLASKEERFQVSGHTCFWGKKELNSWAKEEGDICLVAEDQGEIIGFVLSQYHKPTGKATLENLFVKESYRNNGIGHTLFNMCSFALKENGATYQCGMVEPDNKIIFSMMKNSGFNKEKTFVWVDKI